MYLNKDLNTTDSFNLEFFFELSPDLMCIAGYDGYFKKVNSALLNTLGYTEKELFEKPINEFIHPEDQERTQKKRDGLLQDNVLTLFENRYFHKDGNIVWLQWSSIALQKEKIVYAIAKDITPKKSLELQRNELIESLSESNKDLKFFNYTSSHDLRSPLSNLLSLHQLLDLTPINDPEISEYVDLLKISTEHLNDVINSYMDGWIEKDRLSLNIERISFNSVLFETQKCIQQLLNKDQVTILTDFEEAPTVDFSKNYLQSIFLNLITNSIKYANPDTPAIIEIKSQKSRGSTQLIFKDNGIGIDLESVGHRIFKLHQRFNESKESKGIGLYLVYNHITSLGGTIEVTSKLSAGTVFTLTFKEYT